MPVQKKRNLKLIIQQHQQKALMIEWSPIFTSWNKESDSFIQSYWGRRFKKTYRNVKNVDQWFSTFLGGDTHFNNEKLATHLDYPNYKQMTNYVYLKLKVKV